MTDVRIEASIEPHQAFTSGALHQTGAYDWSVDMRVTPAVGKEKLVRRHGRTLRRADAVRELVREIEDAL